MCSTRNSSFCFVLLFTLVFSSISLGADGESMGLIQDLMTADQTAEPAGKGISVDGYDYYILSGVDGTMAWTDQRGSWESMATFGGWRGGIWGVDGNDVFIANGEPSIQHWDGDDWIAETASGWAMDVFGFARDDVYALCHGEFSTMLYRYDGFSWNHVTFVNSALLYRMWGLANDDLYAVGPGGRIGHFDGSEFVLMNTGTIEAELLGVWGSSSDNVYAVGASGTVLHYDGSTWSPVSVPTEYSGIWFNAIWGTGPEDMYIVGSGGVLLHFDGETMEAEPVVVSEDLYGVSGTPNGEIVVVGNNNTVLRYYEGGWTLDTPPDGLGVFASLRDVWGGLADVADTRWSSTFASPPDGQGFSGSEFITGGYCTEIFGGNLIVGGSFDHAGSIEARNIAMWNGVAWSNIGDTDDVVNDLVVWDDKLIACGEFTTIGGVVASAIASWDGTSWSALGEGIGGLGGIGPWHMAEWNGDLVVVGDFTAAGGLAINYVALWNGSAWNAVGEPLVGGGVYAVTVWDGVLYVGGDENGVFYLDEGSWSVAGALTGTVVDLRVFEGELYAGGGFTTIGGVAADCIAMCPAPGEPWEPVGGGIPGGEFFYSLEVHGDRLVAAGMFSTVGTVDARAVVAWDGQNWSAFGSGVNGFAIETRTWSERLYVVGSFTTAGNLPSIGIAEWVEGSTPGFVPPASTAAAIAGQDYTYTINVVGDMYPSSVVMRYRRRDSDSWHSAMMTPQASKDGIFGTIIPGNYFGSLGFQFYTMLSDGDTTLVYPEGAPTDPGFVSVSINSQMTAPSAATHVMMGVPYNPSAGMESILTGAMGGHNLASWRLGRWDPASSSYDEYPSVEAFVPGRGYWLIQKNPTALPVSGLTTDTSGGVSVFLDPGWNMIATPYNFNINWSSVSRGPNLENRLVARVDGGYVNTTYMEPWKGYWVHNYGVTASWMTIPPTVAILLPKTETTPDEDLDWGITIAAVCGDRFDGHNLIGVAEDATNGVDTRDYHETPSLPGDVSLCFEVDNGERLHFLSTDVRAPFSRGASWDIVLKTDGSGSVDLDFAGVVDVPIEFAVVLLTRRGEIDLRQTSTVTVPVGAGGEARMRLAVGDADFVAEEARTLPRPFALESNYPNPFNPATNVRFSLPHDSHVKVDIFDIRGRQIKCLVDGDFGSGLHEKRWEGLDDTGRAVAAGVYFSRMTAEDFVQTRKMTLVR